MIAVRATRVSDQMFMAAAKALAAVSPAKDNPKSSLLPACHRAARSLGHGSARRGAAGA
ncbi:MAG: malic enzyme-like NAD(P)-binding protein [Aliidongia sp.]